jgi:RNA polymerase sigma-B factor
VTIDPVIADYLANPSERNRELAVSTYYRLCRRAARKFQRRGTDIDDLEQVAAIGLLKALRNFRSSFETPFSAYAWIMIVGELMHYVRDCERTVRLPRRIRTRERAMRIASDEIVMRLGRFPSAREIGSHLGLPLDEVDEIRRLESVIVPLESAAGQPHARAMEDALILRLAVEQLPERERLIVRGTFEEGLTQTELAACLGLTQSHISKLLARALTKLYCAVA